MICGILGISKTKDPRYSGRGLAIAGLLLGLLSLVLWGMFGSGAYALWAYGKPAREAATQYARDLSSGSVDAAMANSTSTIPRAELQAAADKIKAWGPLLDTTLPVVAMNKSTSTSAGTSETVEVGGVAKFQKAPAVPYFAHMVKQNGQFKMDGFYFQNNDTTVTAGTAPKTAPKKSGTSSSTGPDSSE